jgi:hypothetical protein
VAGAFGALSLGAVAMAGAWWAKSRGFGGAYGWRAVQAEEEPAKRKSTRKKGSGSKRPSKSGMERVPTEEDDEDELAVFRMASDDVRSP